MERIELSKRLKTIATFIPKGAFFADIGADHAYLTCYVCLKDPKAMGIASDVNKGPYLAAKKTVQKFNLEDRINVRLGDGLSVINDDKIDVVVISGMGGSLIKNILQNDLRKLESVHRLILQPNIGEAIVRDWINENQFMITEETIIDEKDNFYEIIVADRIKSKKKPLTEKELFFGPILLQKNSTPFKRKWLEQKEKLNTIINQMAKSSNIDERKINQFQQQKQWIQEVLTDD